MKRLHVPLQTEPTECGLVCIEAVTSLLGNPLRAAEIKARYGVSSRGLTLSQLKAVLVEAGFVVDVAIVNRHGLRNSHYPVIALWKGDHFVVVTKSDNRRTEIFDPARGWRTVSPGQVRKNLNGLILEVRLGETTKTFSQPRKNAFVYWAKRVLGHRNLPVLMLLAVAMQACSLAAPWLAGGIVDESVLDQQTTNLPFLLLIYTAFAIAAVVIRSVMQRLSAALSARMSRRLIVEVTAALLKRPIAYFFRNSPAVIASKVQAVNAIRLFVLRLVSATLIQGVSGIVALILMFIVHPLFGAIVLAMRAISIAQDGSLARRLSSMSDERFYAFAEQNRMLIELTRSAPAIKVNRATLPVLRKFRGLSEKSQRADVQFELASQSRQDRIAALITLEQVSLLALGVHMLQSHQIGIGALVAVAMYREMCAAGFHEIQDAFAAYLTTKVAIDRMDDYVESANGILAVDRPSGEQAPTQSEIELRNVFFSYSSFDKPVFERLSLRISEGECVAVVGPSGAGKSTLANLLVGALTPTKGEIHIGGRLLNAESEDAIRRHVGTVMQSDYLITASVYENISFYKKLSLEEVREAAALAKIDEFIESLPMRYQSLIGDEVGGLSGGQRQRILIARALACKPKILIMDEATSYLDERTEILVSENIAQLSITRVILAHRKETIRRADRIIDLGVLNDLREKRAEFHREGADASVAC